jgi:Plant transposon protein
MERHQLRGCFGAWDCKHFVWKNCPMYEQGQYKGHAEGGKRTAILEALADADGYFWYIFFGQPGSLNDINVLNKSSIVAAILDGTFNTRVAPYTMNGARRDWLYFLVDGIYPQWSVFVKPFNVPSSEKETLFNRHQEAARKCVERAFGILVQKFQILKNPIRNWYMEDIFDVMYCCVILHNMVIAEIRGRYDHNNNFPAAGAELDVLAGEPRIDYRFFDHQFDDYNPLVTTLLGHRVALMRQTIENRDLHGRLTVDIMEHLFAQTQNQGNNV